MYRYAFLLAEYHEYYEMHFDGFLLHVFYVSLAISISSLAIDDWWRDFYRDASSRQGTRRCTHHYPRAHAHAIPSILECNMIFSMIREIIYWFRFLIDIRIGAFHIYERYILIFYYSDIAWRRFHILPASTQNILMRQCSHYKYHALFPRLSFTTYTPSGKKVIYSFCSLRIFASRQNLNFSRAALIASLSPM